MSRWIDQFEAHAFQTTWKNLKDNLDGSTVDDESVLTSAAELARLKKVVAYVDELIQGIDPELLPVATWDNFNTQAEPCLQHIANYNNNRNIAHITKANAHADNLLTYIRPYMVVEGKVAKALQASIKKYAQTIDEYGESFKTRSAEIVDDMLGLQTQSNELHALIEGSKKSIDVLDAELFGEGEEVNIEDRIRALASGIEKKYEDITEYYNETLIGDESDLSTKKTILQAKELILEEKEKIEELLATVEVEVNALDKFHTQIFGKLGEDEKRVGGLSKDFDNLVQSVQDFEGIQKSKYAALISEIESLVPGATSAGLASAYRALRKSFAKPIKLYAKLFYASVAALFLISITFVIDDIGLWHIKLVDISNPLNVMNSLIFKLPFILPILWLAIFASKRRSEAHRLQQEYAHKEALAKSYQSFKKQIDALGETDNQLLKQLLETAIGAVAFNASVTLDGKHGDKMPAHEMFESAVKAAVKLKG